MIQGEDIYLRPLAKEDADILFDWENRPENLNVGLSQESITKSALQQYIQNEKDFYLDKQWRLMICSKNHVAIGTIDLFDYDADSKEAGIGILIAEESDRKNGFASQAIGMLTSYAFEILNLNKIFCHVQEDNHASHSLFQKQGFELETDLKDSDVGNENASKYVLKNNISE